ncbi:MAG TPA: hypothetical protein VF771_09255, partial [Longimicrobiaceae bacterium]
MRTDILKLAALALALAAPRVLDAQGAPAAQAAPAAPVDVAPAPEAPAPADVTPAPEAIGPATAAPVAAPAAPEGSQIAFNGMTIPRGKVVDGDVVAPFGDVRVEGEVMGDVTVGKG